MIRIKNLIKYYGDRKLFEVENLEILSNEKVGLVGINGTGKTTLLNIIMKKEDFDGGTLNVSNDLFLVEKENFLNIHPKVYKLFNLKKDDHYSLGEISKLNIFSALENDEFLLIDEPTANLDIKSITKLEDALISREVGFLIVSHDRDFLNKTCNKIIEIENEKINVYTGNYDDFKNTKALNFKTQMREYNKYKSKVKRLNEVKNHFKEVSESIKTSPKRFGNSEARINKMGGQKNKKKVDKTVKAVQSRIDKLEKKERPHEDDIIRLTIPDKDRIKSKQVIHGENFSKSFGSKIIFKNVSIKLDSYSKYALIGDNGTGKSTLIKMILENENIKTHNKLKIGYYSQQNEILDINKSIIENIKENNIYDETLTRIVLARLLFKRDDIYKKVSYLSEGEKTKVKLAKLLLGDYNFLIFDEITNYLDINSLEVLEQLLIEYDRPLILISHDRKFINSISNKLLIIKNKDIIEFDGNLKMYENQDTINKDNLLIDIEISRVISELSLDISNEKKEILEKRYKELLDKRNR